MANRMLGSTTQAPAQPVSAQPVLAPAIEHDAGSGLPEEGGAGSPTRHRHRERSEHALIRTLTYVVLASWLALVVAFGAGRAFVRPAGMPPYPIAVGVAAPLVMFFAAFWLSSAFRNFVMAADLRLVTIIQGWRWAGFGFLALYAYGVLPGRFAWLAGLGDMAIGLTAPWMALALIRRPGFARTRPFVVWNLLGILDLVAAVGNAAIIQTLATGAAGEVTVAPMALMPLVLVPAYLVPLFIILHVVGLLQAKRLNDRVGSSPAGR